MRAAELTLSQIAGVGNCGAPAYQQTPVSVVMGGLDVGETASLAVSSDSVATVVAGTNIVRGLAAGNVIVYLAAQPSLATQNASIAVSDNPTGVPRTAESAHHACRMGERRCPAGDPAVGCPPAADRWLLCRC